MNLLELFVTIKAKDEASDKISNMADGIKGKAAGIAKAGAAAAAAGVAAMGAAAAAAGKQAFDSYADFEQLSGGVDKLYGDSADQLRQYAQEAYKTAGMSANQYMEQATSFSAALVNSLGGDTKKAAEQTDVAMMAMSDNVNVFGSNMEDVQHAFQGFAKQNYTMLDNLKLGYGGTKSEMERLIADANAYGASIGKASDLSIESFSDVVTAIELIQEKQGIAGTTQKEALSTIEGSINATKAAWANLLTEFGKEDGDVGARMNEFVESASAAMDNIVPRIEQIISKLGEAMPKLVEMLGKMAPVIVKAIGDILLSVARELPNLVTQLVPAILDMAPTLIESAVEVFMSIVQALTEKGPELIDRVVDSLMHIVDVVIDNFPMMLEAAGIFFMAIAQAIIERLPDIISKLAELIISLVQFLVDHAPDILAGALQLFGAIVQAVFESIPSILDAVGHIGTAILEILGSIVGRMFEAGANLIGGLIDGILDGLGPLGDALRKVGDFIVQHKGPPEYDRVMLKDNGKLIMGGLIDGVMSGIPELKRTIDDVNGMINVSGSASYSATRNIGLGASGIIDYDRMAQAMVMAVSQLGFNVDGVRLATATAAAYDSVNGSRQAYANRGLAVM